MRILITGATGFVGSNLTAYLASQKNDIAVLLRNSSNTDLLPENLDSITIYRSNADVSELVSILKEFKPEVVVHLASLFLAQHSSEQTQDLINSNILFPTTLLEAMAACGVDKLINTGTSWQHYENQNYNPVNLYAATKRAFEDICDYYYQALEFKIITLKLFETYGPGDPRKKIIPLLLESLDRKEPLTLSPGEQKLDFVHIQDVCVAYEATIRQISEINTPCHLSYGISSGDQISLQNLVEIIEKISGRKLPVLWGGRPYRKREVFYTWKNFTPLPGWSPQISMEEGIRLLTLTV